MTHEAPRLIAFYLPQFHPIPENDQWWGKGFTEWTNVAPARPLFRGHYQPHVPADLGFYDLRLPEIRQQQADLAREYGIAGFCYYHYWFGGRRLLERPFEEVLASGRPDFPFCLCWANENWTRAWDGLEREVLMAQAYGEDDDRRHMRWLAGAFADARYIRVDGKPLFLVYRAGRLPDPRRTCDTWREEAAKAGVGEIFLARVESLPVERGDPHELGFDAAVEFQPDWTRLVAKGPRGLWTRVQNRARALRQGPRIYDYRDIVRTMSRKPAPPYRRFPCVTPSWDNSPRRKRRPAILQGSTPELYEQWLRHVVRQAKADSDSSRADSIIFVNAWNEWAEGAHLEPDQKFGRAYLEATRRALLET